MGASVRLEDYSFTDERFDLLAAAAGLADADHARGKMARLWRTCTIRQSEVLPEAIVAVVLPPQAIVDADLGVRVDGGIRLKGTNGRIEWLGDLRKGQSAGGRARAASAPRDEKGRMVSQHRPAGELAAGTSSPPALSSSLTPIPTPSLKTPIPPFPGVQVPAGELDGLAAGPAAEQPSGRVRSGSKKTKPGEPTPEESAAIERIVAKLNERTGRAYEPGCKETRKKLLGLLRDRTGGQTLERREGDIRLVIWRQADLWASKGDMATFLRPKTLFGAENFANYVVEARAEWAKRQATRDRAPPTSVLEVLAEAQAMAAGEDG